MRQTKQCWCDSMAASWKQAASRKMWQWHACTYKHSVPIEVMGKMASWSYHFIYLQACLLQRLEIGSLTEQGLEKLMGHMINRQSILLSVIQGIIVLVTISCCSCNYSLIALKRLPILIVTSSPWYILNGMFGTVTLTQQQSMEVWSQQIKPWPVMSSHKEQARWHVGRTRQNIILACTEEFQSFFCHTN